MHRPQFYFFHHTNDRQVNAFANYSESVCVVLVFCFPLCRFTEKRNNLNKRTLLNKFIHSSQCYWSNTEGTRDWAKCREINPDTGAAQFSLCLLSMVYKAQDCLYANRLVTHSGCPAGGAHINHFGFSVQLVNEKKGKSSREQIIRS